MKNIPFTLFFLLVTSISSLGQTKKFSFSNEYGNWRGRADYFNWKIFIQADKSFLASIKQIEYYLDPSFKTPKRVITQATGGNNFTLCTNGWGEFIIKIKIIFKNSTPSMNDTYKLDLHSSTRKSRNYVCP